MLDGNKTHKIKESKSEAIKIPNHSLTQSLKGPKSSNPKLFTPPNFNQNEAKVENFEIQPIMPHRNKTMNMSCPQNLHLLNNECYMPNFEKNFFGIIPI